jgi:hypothetical protein
MACRKFKISQLIDKQLIQIQPRWMRERDPDPGGKSGWPILCETLLEDIDDPPEQWAAGP